MGPLGETVKLMLKGLGRNLSGINHVEIMCQQPGKGPLIGPANPRDVMSTVL